MTKHANIIFIHTRIKENLLFGAGWRTENTHNGDAKYGENIA